MCNVDTIFDEEVERLLLNKYKLKIGTDEWKLAMLKVDLLKEDEEYYYWEHPGYWAWVVTR